MSDHSSDARALLIRSAGFHQIVVRVIGALVGLAAAYVAANRTMHELTGGGEIDTARVGAELGVFVAFAGLALTLTSALPIRNDLRRIHGLVATHEQELHARRCV